MGKAPSARPRWTWVLRPVDQASIATLVATSLLAIVVHVMQTGVTEFADAPDDHDSGPPDLDLLQLDVNLAPWPEWALLPGVGETLAKRIVEHRDRVGGFRSIGELTRVRGIGPRTLERLRPHLTLGERRSALEPSIPVSDSSWNSNLPAHSPPPEISPRPSPR